MEDEKKKVKRFAFNRLELSGSLGDMGTLLPLTIALIVVNGLDPTGLFIMIGLFYILSGVYYGVVVPVQPMKAIAAYSIAMALSPGMVSATGLLMGAFMLFIGITGLIHPIGKYTPRSVIRGIQLSTGALLLSMGVKFIVGTGPHQVAAGMVEPYLTVQSIGPIPIGILLGVIGLIAVFLLLENRKTPAALVVITGGALVGIFLGTQNLGDIKIGLYLPDILPFGMPTLEDLTFALLFLVLPQIPLTIGNAVIASTDLTREYFGKEAKRVSYRSFSSSMGLAGLVSFLFGGMPMCHGAGGLAAHYRFGARTAGANIMVGATLLMLAVLFGEYALIIVSLLPFSILGVLLVFAGGELALMIKDVRGRTDLFVVIAMLGITLATNLAVAFFAGIALAYAFKTGRIQM